ncbi:hypothetical protein OEZ85_007888 [Tetradesmus obliquus]|uniref:Guanylate cyclase domain-containing protein n=1 Tax=Tetradesmus obliquus TaxID=3088 RepID=A0ABY8TJJ1_TETOB|nr:hypothetical protein OEZ85_007888 [Tetradesmus obliquus]
MQGTCEALQTFGRALGQSTWFRSTGWQDVPATATPATACQAYLSGSKPDAAASPAYCSWYGITCNSTTYSTTCATGGPAAQGIRSVELTNNNVIGRVDDPAFLQAIQQLHDCGLKELVIGGSSFGLLGTLSPAIAALDKLQVLALFATNISGTIPPELGSMSALQELDLSTNYLSGTIPPQLGSLANLQSLNLGYNGFTDVGKVLGGRLPASFARLSQLRMLMLEHNALTGSLPQLCSSLPQLEAISLRNNLLTGSATQFGDCRLTALDISDNYFTGLLPAPRSANSSNWHRLQVYRANNNNFSGPLPQFAYGEAPVLAALVLANNSLTGPLPISWTLLPWLTMVDASNNELSGTLPWQLAFQSKLSILALHGNAALSGSISPWWRFTVGLSVLQLGHTNISGPLPGISRSDFYSGRITPQRVCGSNASGFGRLPGLESASIAGTLMSASCGAARQQSGGTYHECGSIDDALPWYLTVDNRAWQVPNAEANFSDNKHMQCPMVYQDLFCSRNGTPQQYPSGERPLWAVSPSYYHYLGCQCAAGFTSRRELAWHGDVIVSRLVCDKSLTLGEVVGLSIAVSAVGLALLAYCLYVAWSGRWGLPKLQRAYVDIRKRLLGAPTSGRVSLVVTDIESYSALMVAMPLVMGRALAQHNNAVRKAAWAHFGFTVCQEGDSYTLAFREALDAVAFCLQVQQALQKTEMGVASGVLEDKEECLSCRVLEVARVVSDAGSGGQVLLDSNTFAQIKDRLEELGQVGPGGYVGSRVVGWGNPRGWLAKLVARQNLSLISEALPLLPAVAAAGEDASQAVLVDAGGSKPYAAAAASSNKSAAAGVDGDGDVVPGVSSAAGAPGTGMWRHRQRRRQQQQQQQQQQGSALLGSSYRAADASNAIASMPKGGVEQSCVHLAPSAGLGLGQSPAWPMQDAESAVTFVFCSVVTPRSKLSMDTGQAKLSAQLSGIISRVIRHCLLALSEPTTTSSSSSSSSSCGACQAAAGQAAGPPALRAAGYLCREMQGDMKYILAFSSPRLALEWCLLVQEALLWQDWPPALFDKPHAAADRRSHLARLSTVAAPGAAAAFAAASAAGADVAAAPARTGPLFRGPRMKMGVACGPLRSVAVDHLGRADYHAVPINMAARYEAVCAQGGQVDSQAMTQSPSTGGLASWLGAGSKASFALRGAGSSGRRKSAGGRGLRLLQQRGMQRGPAQVMPRVPIELPCELCVPQLPPEAFGVEVHQLGSSSSSAARRPPLPGISSGSSCLVLRVMGRFRCGSARLSRAFRAPHTAYQHTNIGTLLLAHWLGFARLATVVVLTATV